MDTSSIKNIFAKLGDVKNYASFIPTIVILFLAIILLLLSLFMRSGLKSTVEKQSIKLAKDVSQLSGQQISKDQWKVAQKYQDALYADANTISQMIQRTSQRELLSYEVFPEPKDTSVLIFKRFGSDFRKAVENKLAEYNARRCPGEREIEEALQRVSSDNKRSNTAFNPMAMMAGVSPGGGKSRSRTGKRSKIEEEILNEICVIAAENTSFYVDPEDIAGYEFWAEGENGDRRGLKVTQHYKYDSIEQSVITCWYWQVGYWIIEDVLSAIDEINENCDNVLDCPVKRLSEISFGGSSSAPSSIKIADGGRPKYVKDGESGLAKPHTRRYSDGNIDVVHFTMTVLLDAQYTMKFMEELCSSRTHTFKGWNGDEPVQKFKHNQITIIESTIDAVDTGDFDHELYRYGNNATVSMELVCEYVFDRRGFKMKSSEDPDGPDSIVPAIVRNPAGSEKR